MNYYMKILLTLFLLISIGCSSVTLNKVKKLTNKEIAACKYIYSHIKKVSEKNVDPVLRNNTELIMEGILIVASYRDAQSDQYLVKFLGYYIGSEAGAYLSDLIIKRNKQIFPALYKLKDKQAFCNSEQYQCGNYRYKAEELMSRISNQNYPDLKTDFNGEPFSYISKEELKQRFDNFKSTVENIKKKK